MTEKTGRLVAKKVYGHDNIENEYQIKEYAELVFMNGRRIYELTLQNSKNGKVLERFYYNEKPDVQFLAEGKEAEWEITRTDYIFDDEYELQIKEVFKKRILHYLAKMEKVLFVEGHRLFIDKSFLLEELSNYLDDNDFYSRNAMYQDGFYSEEYKDHVVITRFLEKKDFEIAYDIRERCDFKLRYFPAKYENKKAFLEVTKNKRTAQIFGYEAAELYDKMI
ncbi:hypothetical protein [Listeria seeligeri]|uniref:hypothetical protein n=1 Tax=Listeria seeligeri TaxID=1640 RepID=UPI0022EA56E6|nr:hypothetical protein [Listeria seeligeri]